MLSSYSHRCATTLTGVVLRTCPAAAPSGSVGRQQVTVSWAVSHTVCPHHSCQPHRERLITVGSESVDACAPNPRCRDWSTDFRDDWSQDVRNPGSGPGIIYPGNDMAFDNDPDAYEWVGKYRYPNLIAEKFLITKQFTESRRHSGLSPLHPATA